MKGQVGAAASGGRTILSKGISGYGRKKYEFPLRSTTEEDNLIRAMACNSMTIPSPSTSTIRNDVFKQQNGLARSDSCKDLRSQGVLRRSSSENHICCTTNTRMQQPKLKSSRSFGIFPIQISSSSVIPRPLEIVPNSIRTFLFDPEASKGMVPIEKKDNAPETPGKEDEEKEVNRANWVDRLLEIRSHWMKRQQKEDEDGDEKLRGVEENGECSCDDELDGCTVDYNEELEGEETKYDRKRFSRFLGSVPWSDTRLFSKLAFLCNMAYVIPEIKASDLRRYYGLRFVTSSLEKKAEAAAIKEKLDQDSMQSPAIKEKLDQETHKTEQRLPVRSSVYGIAASAASFVQSRAKGYFSCLQEEGDSSDTYRYGAPSEEEGESSPRIYKSEVAAVVAASTMTAVVAAGEKEKLEAAAALQSLHSSPCEWFICDDISTYTRSFVIQGSDSLASWQANLFFEPAKFEETDVLVHRGIYEAAKGIYEQFMPEIIEHLNRHGERAKLQFTGHSLGGSLSVLVNLMLLKKKVVKPSALRPVVTFGSPFVLCGGERILVELGLDDNHIYSVMMHRDIVPRAFSCNYPTHVAQVLKRLNGSFRSHPCLLKNKLLYSPVGKLFILQPDEKSSPPHPFLPPGAALYELDKTRHGYSASVLKAFLNSPHPLETLSDPTAYGSEGTILRDHDSSNYLKAVNGVLRQNTKKAPPLLLLKATTESNLQWPLLAAPSPHSWSNDASFDGGVLVAKEAITV